MKIALVGIEYFQTYYQHWLLFAVAASMFGWAMYLQQRISKKNRMGGTPVLVSKQLLRFLLGGFGLTIATFAYRKRNSALLIKLYLVQYTFIQQCSFLISDFSSKYFVGCRCSIVIANCLLDAMFGIQISRRFDQSEHLAVHIGNGYASVDVFLSIHSFRVIGCFAHSVRDS